MSKREDLNTILVIGSGPIVIGQACEFDYSGVQACKALREEGYKIILINSNPATVMTDDVIADVVYIEPITLQFIEQIIQKEKPDAILPTVGGQTALNCALELWESGILQKYNIEMIGATPEAIFKAESREAFDQAMKNIHLETPRSIIINKIEGINDAIESIGFPCVIRPSFTLGGYGGGIAYNQQELLQIVKRGLELSPVSQLQIDESLLGWKEFEMEVVRDLNDNCIIVCSIENLEPIGIHTGDSVTVSPAQTLTDKEYQKMRDASLAILREIGVETGGSNVQFALHPETGRMLVIEMNPRVSRSSALASKVTGFPIAKIATKLAVGYTLDELSNEITGNKIPASFEPTIDYVAIKWPRFNFLKFPKDTGILTTQMKSVGEVMALGTTFQSAFQKAIQSLERDTEGLGDIDFPINNTAMLEDFIGSKLKRSHYDRFFALRVAFQNGLSIEDIYQLTRIDPWFLNQILDLVQEEDTLKTKALSELTDFELRALKYKGFSDQYLASLLNCSQADVLNRRQQSGISPIYHRIDSCAAEFDTETAYLYSEYPLFPSSLCESRPTDRPKVMVIGSGPNRIGQGIEFDYCCVHAAIAAKEMGYETIMVNCNPETVSTDFDVSDRLYFEPINLEYIWNIIQKEKPNHVILQFGGQTPLKLALELEARGVSIIGTKPDAIDLTEDRDRFRVLLQSINLRQPKNKTVMTIEAAFKAASEIGYPVIVRPSYVLGGRAMEVIYNAENLERYMTIALKQSPHNPVLIDQFLDSAIEVDVDLVSDGEYIVIAAIMEHIEQAGIHSGDSACSFPPYSISEEMQLELKRQARLLAKSIQVVGLVNIQFAIADQKIYVLEVNPRASRTVPFVSKSIGYSLAMVATRAMLGSSLIDQGMTHDIVPNYISVKQPVFSFKRFEKTDIVLGPEMKSTGEVMAAGSTFGEAFGKSIIAAGNYLPEFSETCPYVFISVRDQDKYRATQVAKRLLTFGFKILCTEGTHQIMLQEGIESKRACKINEERPNIIDQIKSKEIGLVINTTSGRRTLTDSASIREAAMANEIFCITTIAGAEALCDALTYRDVLSVISLSTLNRKVS